MYNAMNTKERKKHKIGQEKFSAITYTDLIPWSPKRQEDLDDPSSTVFFVWTQYPRSISNNNFRYLFDRAGCPIEAVARIMKPHMNPATVIVLWRGRRVAGDYPSWTHTESSTGLWTCSTHISKIHWTLVGLLSVWNIHKSDSRVEGGGRTGRWRLVIITMTKRAQRVIRREIW
jgi:hypothetical protein